MQDYRVTDVPDKHPFLFEPSTLVFGVLLGLLGVIIGVELLTRVGIAPNTSVIGAIIAIAVSRIPLSICGRFRSLPRQNLLQTVISGATFGGANAILLPMGIIWLYGDRGMVPVMFLGAVLGLLIDATIVYRVFDSRIYPAGGIWPPGVATAECLIAGDRGGRRALLLGVGAGVGGVGRIFGIPMDIVGVCWIGNRWALFMFGLGLLITGYSTRLFGIDINDRYIPHGVMIGAGAVAIFQIVHVISRRKNSPRAAEAFTTSPAEFGRSLGLGFLAFVLVAALLAVAAGLYAEMTVGMLAGFVVFAAFAAIVSELIVGISAMHAGWFPAFATALIFLVLGMLIGFPPLPLAFLVGFTASTGPAFADMGYDFKTGWILRGSGEFSKFERQGRRQQYFAALLGFAVAAIMVLLTHEHYFRQDLFPPVDRVFVATIAAGANAQVAGQLFVWAVPGALVQLVGGPSRQIGVLLATGLLIHNPAAGWTALLALGIRTILLRKYGKSAESPMYVLAGGFIAGSALAGFGTAALKTR